MKLKELFESVDFYPSFINDNGYIQAPMEKKEMLCIACDGSKIDYMDPEEKAPCPDCNGKGTELRHEYTVPHIQVSNTNAMTILQMMGIPDNNQDYAGTIKNNKLPEIKRRLLLLKNSEKARDKHTRDTQDTRGTQTSYVDNSGDVPEIKTRGGARMIAFGLNQDQINRYVNILLDIVSVAQEKGYDVSWG